MRSYGWQIITPTIRPSYTQWFFRSRLVPIRRLSQDVAPKSRFKLFESKLRDRYPNISPNTLPSLTVAFVLLHELTAIVPLFGTFLIFQSTGTGEQIVSWIKNTITSSRDIQSEKSTASITNWLNSFIATTFDEGSKKISRIALRYGWVNAEKIQSSDTDHAVDRALSMLDSGVVASGLIAYLSVKALFPLRIAISLYLTPSFARYFQSFYSLFKTRKKNI